MNLTQRNASYLGTALPYISSSSTTSKTITSGLTASINASVIITVNTCELTASYRGQNIEADSCSSGQAIFILNEIPTGNSVLSLFQAVCQSNERFAFNLILIFSVLAVVSTTIIFVYKKGGLPQINAKILIIGFLLVTIGVVFVVQIANDSASFCPA